MSRKCEDLIGRKFGRLTVVARAPDYIRKDGRKEVMWECMCDCGDSNPVVVMGGNLKRKNRGTQSCGCLAKELSSIRAKENTQKLHQNNKKENPVNLDGEYGIGWTLKGEEFWFDKEDYDVIKKYCWHYNCRGYLETNDSISKKQILLHRLVMGVTDPKVEVDHKRHPPRREHKVDNRKSNLRIVTHADNAKNHIIQINNTSGVSGVHFSKRDNKWIARISVNGSRIYLGSFDNKDDAIQARKEAEIKYFGEYRYDVYNVTEQNDLRNEEVM